MDCFLTSSARYGRAPEVRAPPLTGQPSHALRSHASAAVPDGSSFDSQRSQLLPGLSTALVAALVGCGVSSEKRRRRQEKRPFPKLVCCSSSVSAEAPQNGSEKASDASPAKAAKDADYGGPTMQAALFLMYFCGQAGMTFYMKFIMSKIQVTSKLVGVPASFLVTSSQQVVIFLLFLVFLFGTRVMGKAYKPKVLASKKEYLLILILSASFAMNIGLNNFSLCLVPLSITLVIRACLPLSTAVTQTLVLRKETNISPAEWICMIVGVTCAVAVVVAQSGNAAGAASASFLFGIFCSVASVFCGACDMVIKSLLGTSLKLKPMDTIAYMAVPTAFFTFLIGSLWSSPVSTSWAANVAPNMTNLEVFRKIWELNPSVFLYVGLSGLLCFFYNNLQTFMAVNLSPATTAFAGNFNKAATILIALLFLDGRLPSGIRGVVVVGGILVNIASFTAYNILKKRKK
eukprot:TRINITY_DN111591_c0_g1_i1.p1 TRINITY_DN111591_c0_g1~~TRINITY_DN111591_c0_g1_i1.p1  ORF type:complete len:477 (-),score=88.73 TRINITY_DN111591_c0_g1_i1:162-1541(-)